MSDYDYSNELSQFDSLWPTIPDNDDLPDGVYQASIDSVSIGRSKGSGRLQLEWSLVVIEGDYRGRWIFRYSGLGSEENLRFLKKDLTKCGVSLDRISDLQHRLRDLLDVVVEVELKTKASNGKQYQNSYIVRRLGVYEDPVLTDTKKGKGKGKPKATMGNEIPFNEEDIPF